MLVVLPIHDYKQEHITFLTPVKNNIIDGYFTRILYTDPIVTIRGIYIHFPLKGYVIESMSHKQIYTFDLQLNHPMIENMMKIEKNILEKFSSTKEPKYVITEQLQQKYLKINHLDNTTLVLKISGIWETSTTCGIAYKFVMI